MNVTLRLFVFVCVYVCVQKDPIEKKVMILDNSTLYLKMQI